MSKILEQTIQTVKDQGKQLSEIVTDNQQKMKVSTSQVNQIRSSLQSSIPPSPPKWLIFKNQIFNTNQIQRIALSSENYLILDCLDGKSYNVDVSGNVEQIWKKLQHVFAFGVTKEDNEKTTDLIQENRDGSNSTMANHISG